MHLVMFDIDGTLTRTYEADSICFVQALADVFGFADVDADWANYPHATDSGILQSIFQTRFGRFPSDTDISGFRQHFIALLKRTSLDNPFAPVHGAPRLLSYLSCSADYKVALATGAWSDSARLKMASAGMCFEDYPSASSDDAISRESIVRIAMQRAAARYGTFSRIVYVGDGVWDARTCRTVGMPFIGIATGARAARLSEEGAVSVFPDFSDTQSFLSCLRDITK